jgi:type III secretion protein D
MDRAPTTIDTLHALELRVTEGPQAGARAPLTAGADFVIATAGADGVDADIILRDVGAVPARLRVTPELGQAPLEVLQGEVRLGGQLLRAGARAAWDRHAPLTIGTSVVAFGLACEDEWPSGAPAAGLGEATGDLASPAQAGAEKTARAPLRRRAEVWLAATGAGVLVACAGTLWMAHVAAAPPAVQAVAPAPLDVTLAGSEFAALQLTTRPDGRVELRGRLATMAERARLDLWLTAQRATPVLDVIVDEAVAREVAEVFRVHGVAVQVRAAGPGRIVAEAAEADASRLARAEDAARRDVRGLDHFELRNSVQPAPAPMVPVADDPNKRITSLVPGNPAYVVTADGARYFVGAMLPSGWRLAQVAGQSVTLERDGRLTTLQF